MNYLHPEYNQIVREHFDITDNRTRKILLAVNEADQSNILHDLSNKLYKKIVDKVGDIDFGTIPQSKGDIDNLDCLTTTLETLDIMEKLVAQYRQDTSAIREVTTAIQHLRSHKEYFVRGFVLKQELPMMIYNTTVLSVISSTSFLVSSIIDFVKDPNGTYQASLDRTGLKKSKEHLLIKNLAKFNASCVKGDMKKVLSTMTSGTVREGVVLGSLAMLPIAIATIAIIIPLLREAIYFFFYIQVKLKDFLNYQADLVQMNIYNLEADENIEPDRKQTIMTKQSEVVTKLRTVASKFDIESKKAENKVKQEIKQENTKYKIDDVITQMPDSASAVDSLF